MAKGFFTRDEENAYNLLSNATKELDAVYYDASQVIALNWFEKYLKLLKKYVASSPYMDKLSKKALEAMPSFENVLLKLEYLKDNPDYVNNDDNTQCNE